MTVPRTIETDRREIRAVVDGWILWRDSGEWDELRASWHPGGRMSSTRFHGLADDFVTQTRRGYEAGSRVRHTQNGFWCELDADRAITVTGMSIMQRAALDDVAIDVTCVGCFVDFHAYRDGRWALDRRQPAYDWDRIDPVDPGASLALDQAMLASFPPAYRHLAYLQQTSGLTINRDLPEARGPEFAALLAEARAWSAAGEPQGRELSSPRRVIVVDADGAGSAVGQDGRLDDGRLPVPGLRTRLVWATNSASDYRTPLDAIEWPKGIAPLPGGTRFSIIDLAPGYYASALHRTDTVDYVICLSGRAEMLLDDGTVSLAAGDVAIQCGTNHGWANPGRVPARIAVILIDGQPKRDGSIGDAAMAP